MSDQKNIAWIDLETTGSDEEDGSIIEIGCIVTDAALEELGRWEAVVEPISRRDLDSMDPVVRDMHTENGLLAALDAGVGIYGAGADDSLAEFLDRFTVDGTVILAGSGVGHFDSRWVRRHLERTARRLTYWTLDVGVLRRWFRLYAGLEITGLEQSQKSHRAMADVELHLEEGRAFASLGADVRGWILGEQGREES